MVFIHSLPGKSLSVICELVCIPYFESKFMASVHVFLLWLSLPRTSGVPSVNEEPRSVAIWDTSGFQPETLNLRVAALYDVPTPVCLIQTSFNTGPHLSPATDPG